MSVVTYAIGCAKRLKHKFDAGIRAMTPVYISQVRRIERVVVKERVVAMTFDDGPCRMPAKPSQDERPLTLRLVETLEEFGARGTFDIVGDTSGNYPDLAGDEGSPQWGGIRYDHYPDFGCDADGGAVNCPELVRRILDGGHEISSHTYSHVLFGKKPLVYGGRDPLPTVDAVIADLRRLHDYMKSEFGYTVRLSRPPHYVDRCPDGFDSYDAYAVMGYQYMAASFDGAGWLPLHNYEAECGAMLNPLRDALSADPDALCGQIIFQKDGYNMARRSPVADGLPQQLRLLGEYGYRVVTVSELLDICPFADLAPDDAYFNDAKYLLDCGYPVCYRDNTVRAETGMTRGELAMMLYGSDSAMRRIELVRNGTRVAADIGSKHPYAAAIDAAVKTGAAELCCGKFMPSGAVGRDYLVRCLAERFGALPDIGDLSDSPTRGEIIGAAAAAARASRRR